MRLIPWLSSNHRRIIFSVLFYLLSIIAPAKEFATGPYDILNYGAVADGTTMNTSAIQQAIDACATAGGGTVVIPAGRFLSAPIFLKSNVTLHLDNGSTLTATSDMKAFPTIEGRWEGIDRTIYASLITALDCENIAITGKGALDCQGKVWQDTERLDPDERRKRFNAVGDRSYDWKGLALEYPRPRAIYLHNCRHVTLRDITVINSPSWTIHPAYCDFVNIDGVTVSNDPTSPNTDGIDPDSCRNMTISNCQINTGDDCIAIKSGYNEYGRKVGRPTENLTITNCVFRKGRGGVVIGSETAGSVRNVTISNCIFDGTLRGIRFKSGKGRGGIIENIRCSNLVLRDIEDVGLNIEMIYGEKKDRDTTDTEAIPVMRDIHYSDITGKNVNKAVLMVGLSDSILENISFNRIDLQAKVGIVCERMANLAIRDCFIIPRQGPALTVKDCDQVDIFGFKGRPAAGTPVVLMDKVRNGYLHGCAAFTNQSPWLQCTNMTATDLVVQENNFAQVAIPVAGLK